MRARALAEETEGLISPNATDRAAAVFGKGAMHEPERLTMEQTADFALLFTPMYFAANYLVSASLEHTSVGSSTILCSTSSIFTLIFGALFQVERFSWKNLVGVLASFAGILLVSLVDLSKSDNDSSRGSFPQKSAAEMAVGNIMAFGSSIMYGIYVVVTKKALGNEDRVDMLMMFGFLGLFSMVFLWPGLLILHVLGVETMELPPNTEIWAIVLVSFCYSQHARSELLTPRADRLAAQCRSFIYQRSILDLRHAAHHPSSRHCRIFHLHPAFPRRTDAGEPSILQLALLARRLHRRSQLPLCEQRDARREGVG